jgi:hypothetical protein
MLTRENVGKVSNEQIVVAGAVFYPALSGQVVEITLP